MDLRPESCNAEDDDCSSVSAGPLLQPAVWTPQISAGIQAVEWWLCMVGGGCCASCLPVSPGPGQVLVTCNQRKFAHDSRAGLGWAGVGTVTDTLYLHL